MTGAHVLVELVIVLGTAAVITVAFQALRLPVVLGYVLAGLVIGPHVPFPLVADASLVHVLSELGVILLMFTVGLELRLSTLARVGLPAALTALFEVGLVLVVGSLVATALGFSATEALFVGALLSIASTMLVAKAFEERGWKGGFTEVAFALLVFEDLIAIVLLAVLTGVASGAGLAASDVLVTVAKLAGFLAAVLAGGLLVVPRFVRWIGEKMRPETLLVTALAICAGGAALADHFGYSVALGAFLGGVLVAESGRGHDVFAQVRPFRDLFAMVFFVSVGMTIDPAELWRELPTIAAFSAVVLVVKPLGVALGTFVGARGLRDGIRAGVSLAVVGELSFVIAGIGAAGGVARPSLVAIAVGVSCVTTLTSPLMVGRSLAIADWLVARLPKRVSTFVSFYEGWLGRLRARDRSTWHRVRRPIVVLALDVAALVAIVIAAAAIAPRLTFHALAGAGVVAAAAALAIPFLVSALRRTFVISRVVAAEVIPGEPSVSLPREAALVSPGVDPGRAPRRALAVVLQLAIGLAVAVPLIAVTQPFLPGAPAIVLVVLLGGGIVARRRLVDFDGHVRAGSELILELLAQPPDAEHPAPLAQLDAVLPGFGDVTQLALGPASPAAGRSLADLDLRARTGASVLAIARDGRGLATPSPAEPLRAGDVLALTGSPEAIAAARELLGNSRDS